MKPIFSEYFYSFLGLWVGLEQSKHSLMLPIDSREYPMCRCVICVKFIFDHTHPYIMSGVGKTEKKEVPKATHVVEFKRQGVPTSLKVPVDMVGKKAAELSTTSYGAAKAWLLLEPPPAPPLATAS